MDDFDLDDFVFCEEPVKTTTANPTDFVFDDFAREPDEPILENVVPVTPLTNDSFYKFQLIDNIMEKTVKLAKELLKNGPFSFHDLDSVNNPKSGGVYALYYQGDLRVYKSLRSIGSTCPLYVGKSTVNPIARLKKHRESLQQANLGLENFTFRLTCLSPEQAEFAESLLIKLYHPIWNDYLKGFGNNPHDEATHLKYQLVSLWDTYHPGRAVKARALARQREDIERDLEKVIPTYRLAYEQASELLK